MKIMKKVQELSKLHLEYDQITLTYLSLFTLLLIFTITIYIQ